MKFYFDKFQDWFFNNSVVIFLVFLVLIKPYFIGQFSFVNKVCNLLLIGLAIVTYFYSFYKNKPSKMQFAIFLFMGILFLSTCLESKDYSFYLKYFIQYSTITLYTELLIKKNFEKMLKSLSLLLFLLIFFNLVAYAIFPKGIFGEGVLLLGYDNATAVTLVLGSMFLCFASYYFHEKMNAMAISSVLMVLITYLTSWSVGAIIGCGVIILFFLFFYKRNKRLAIIFNARTFFWLAFLLFLGIVIFEIQEYFSYIIVNIFHKNTTLTGRIYIWDRCFKQISLHPFFGIGMMEYGVRYQLIRIYHAHSLFLNVILESGFIGLLSYFYMWHLSIRSLVKKRSHELSNIITFALFSFLVMTLIDVIDNSEVLYIMLVLSYYMPYIIRKKEKYGNQKRALVVVDSGQPIPAVKGGAVETLIDSYLLENEKTKEYLFDVYSTYDSRVKSIVSSYHYTNFYYIHKKRLWFQIQRVFKKGYEKLFRKPKESVFSSCLIRDIISEQKENYYDLILIENAPTLILTMKKKIHGKYILHLHNDLNNIRHYNNCFLNYDSILCCSKYIEKRVRKKYPTSKTCLVYNGIQENELLPYLKQRKKLRKSFGLSKNDFVFGFCGRICQDKGVKELVMAFQTLLKEKPNIKLVIVGNSIFKDSKPTSYVLELQEMTKDIQDSIIFTGYIDHNQIGTYYSCIDVSVQPSIVNEACPLTILEAEIMGVPIIASKSGGIPELVTKKNAILVSRSKLVKGLTNAMRELLENRVKVKEMKKYSLENGKLYYVATYLQNFFHELNRVMDEV